MFKEKQEIKCSFLILIFTQHTTGFLGMLCRLVALDSTVLQTVHTVEIEYERAEAVLAAPKKIIAKSVRLKRYSTYLAAVAIVSWWRYHSWSVVCV